MDNSKPVWAVIPASGIGSRMQSDRPKQYLPFCGKTILEHTLEGLLSCPHISGAVLILREDDDYWEGLNYVPYKPFHMTTGGAERQDSVINGVSLLSNLFESSYALVHDAVRPLVTHNDISRLIKSAQQSESGAILASPITDTLKRADNNEGCVETVDRSNLWRALTPQLFDTDLLLEALLKARASNLALTDDASAMEAGGYKPKLVEGSGDNIKITRPDDLRLAKLIWESQQLD